MPTPVIETTQHTSWNNWHRTASVGGSVRTLFKPRNLWSPAAPGEHKWFEPGLAGLRSIVQQAESAGRRVRAIGSGWSLSSVAYVDDFLVDTSALSEWSLGFSAPMVEPAHAARRERLVLAQCGVQIRTLDAHLEQRRLALPTQGASNGQTIVGAMSTGTHGSAHDMGSIADFILGLHIVAEGGRHYWVQRSSDPVTTPAFAAWLDNAVPLRDDELFNAAVVGFGSFGLIHAVLFEAEPVFVLDKFVRRYDYPSVVRAATTLDLAGLGLPSPVRPFHFEVVVNPYRRGVGEGGAFVRVYYKTTLGPNDPLPVLPVGEGDIIRSPDLVNVISTLSDAVPALVPGLLQDQLENSFRPTPVPLRHALPGQIFDDTLPTNGGTSLEIGVPLARVRDTLDAIFRVTDAHVFGAPIALRYVRSSSATLAFTCHAPTTCTLEMPGIDSATAAAGHQRIFAALDSARIPATYHWGQQGPFTATNLAGGYGAARIERWLTARRRFLHSAAGRRTFSNALLDACGLSG
jgi:FAD/FMN-containing dehydrogenase